MKLHRHFALMALMSSALAHAGPSRSESSQSVSHSYVLAKAEQLGVSLSAPARRELLQRLQGSHHLVSREVDLTLRMAWRLERQTPEERRITLLRAREDTRRALKKRWCEGDAEAAVWMRHYPALQPVSTDCALP